VRRECFRALYKGLRGVIYAGGNSRFSLARMVAVKMWGQFNTRERCRSSHCVVISDFTQIAVASRVLNP
jgi:hypothetical protein